MEHMDTLNERVAEALVLLDDALTEYERRTHRQILATYRAMAQAMRVS